MCLHSAQHPDKENGAAVVFVHGMGELLVWYMLERPVECNYTNYYTVCILPGASRVVVVEWCRHVYSASRQLEAWPGGEGPFSGMVNKDAENLLCVTMALNRNMCLLYTYIICVYTY